MSTATDQLCKGLSCLQRSILQMGLVAHERTPDRPTSQGLLRRAEIFADYFGFQTKYRGKLSFSLHGIGEKPYRAANASLSRAISRLEHRGLVENRGHSLKLTPAGMVAAKRLTNGNCEALLTVAKIDAGRNGKARKG